MEYPRHGHVGTTFLMETMVLHVIPLSCHLGLSVAVAALWLRTRFKGVQSSGEDETRKGRPSVHQRLALWTSFSLAVFYLLLFLWSYFCHQHDDWRNQLPVAQCDLAVRTISWLAVFAYLLGSSLHGFPVFLRIWWCLFFVLSCSSLLIHFMKHGFTQVQLVLLDSGSLLAGLILNLVGFYGGRIQEDTALLQEPLLNGASGPSTPTSSSGTGDAPPSLFAGSGILSVLTFSWIGPLLSTGHSKSLDLKDVPQADGSDTVSVFFPRFKRRLEAYSSNTGASSDATNGITSFQLAKSLVLSTWEQVAFTAVLEFISTAASFVGPYLINDFVQYLSGDRRFASEGFLLVCAFVGSKLVVGVCNRQYSFSLTRVGIRLRGSLVAMIYQKGLKLSISSRQQHTSGKITNYIGVDAQTVAYACDDLHSLWQIPLQIVLALLVLYSSLGLAALIALSASFIIMVVNIPLSKLLEGYIKKLMEARDNRMKATSEILRNMRVLKLQAWEMKFLSKILDLRNNEVKYLWKFSYTQMATSFLFSCSSTFVSALTFGACMLMGIPLRSGNVLTALATLGSLQQPVYSLPFFFQNYVQTKVSLDRISSFLRLEELMQDVVEKLPSGSSEVAIQVTNGSFSLSSSADTFTLEDLDFRVLRGMKVAICGTAGSGKSSLLSCLLGEVPKLSGSVQICGTVAYVPQTAWILSGTIQENILFGKEMDTDKYDRVLNGCSLKKDLESMAFGDQTIIGERGINLSGGQKQRIQIARAIYHDPDIYLFDDPFSAVDAHTGSHLYKELLCKMLSEKTVVYVTHQVEFLPSADLILVMKDGRIAQAGKYSDILNSGINFMELVKAHGDALASYDLRELSSDATSTATEDENSDTKTTSLVPHGNQTNVQNDSPDEVNKEQLVQEEEREKGKVEFKVYWRYITMAYKGALWPLIMLAHVLFQIFMIGSSYWMVLAAPLSNDSEHVSGMMLIAVYVALTIGSYLCMLVASLLLQIAGFKTATLLFDKMHTCVFRAPMAFFDSTPSGRILNRVSSDQNKVDLAIPYRMYYLAFSFIQLWGVIATMSQVSWQVLIVFVPVIAACIWYQQFYLVTSRELSRLTGVCSAPIIHHFAESLSGAISIRCFRQENRFTATNCKLVDDLSRLKFHSGGTSQWLSFRTDMLSSLTFAFTLICLVLIPDGLMNPGIAGVSVIYGLRLNGLQKSLISNLCTLENMMICVERILQYTSIPNEPPLTMEANKLDINWPSEGEIKILNLQVRYRPNLPLVLKGITFTFPGGKKIGIVGRTGSGKSTLIQAIFRIMDPAIGQISIDGLDISNIGLHDLRSRLSIIPQDPTMFKGTLRSNLDPLEEYTDEQIWKALDLCQLGEVRNKELKLDSEVTENGENWSVGQRQLVCLARVILKRSKILILDEATASVDTSTDNVIQKTLRQEFSQSTVITVAHRITSILDSDIVLVLDNGVITECDNPKSLLTDKTSMFAKLVSEYTMRYSSNFVEQNNVQGA